MHKTLERAVLTGQEGHIQTRCVYESHIPLKESPDLHLESVDLSDTPQILPTHVLSKLALTSGCLVGTDPGLGDIALHRN